MEDSVRTRSGWRRAGLLGLGALLVGSLTLGGLPAPSAQAAATELISNGGFENGTTDWQGLKAGGSSGGVTLAATTEDHVGGSSALKVTGRTGTQAGPYQNLGPTKLVLGGTYHVSVKVKYVGGETVAATKTFNVTGYFGGFNYSSYVSKSLTKGEWGTIEGDFTVSATQAVSNSWYGLMIETGWTSSPTADADLMDYYVDDFSLTAVSVPEQTAAPLPTKGTAKAIGTGNPVITHKFGADAYAMEYKGRVYVFMTNDTDEWQANSSGVINTNDYGDIRSLVEISSSDLVNWTDHGDIPVAGASGVATWASNSWAPAATWKTIDGKDKFFLYFANSAGGVGVLTADSPIGPWTSPLNQLLINSSTPGASANGNWLFDPGVVTDPTTNKSYLYFGGGSSNTAPDSPKTTRWIQLGDDMISTVGTAQVIDAPAVFEASHVFERNGKYYYSYSSNFTSPHASTSPGYGTIAYLMADSPEGPWTPAQYKGEVLLNMATYFGVGGNNHQSFFKLGDQYYITYHAQTLDKAIEGASGVKGFRSTHINKVEFNADGTMKQVIPDYQGVSQVANFDPYAGTVQAETIGYQDGITTTTLTNAKAGTPNLALNNIDNGDWTSLSKVDFGSRGAAKLTARVKALTAGGSIEVRTGTSATTNANVATSTNLIATIPVDSAVGSWADISASLTGLTGVQDVYFVYKGVADAELFQVDSYTFQAAPSDVAASIGAAEVSAVDTHSATVTASITPGTADQQAWIEYSVRADHSKPVSTEKTDLPAGLSPVALTAEIGGLAPGTSFSYRVVTESSAGQRVTSDWSDFATAEVKDPQVSLTATPATARVGDRVTLTWTTADASALAASGGWSGAKALSGSESVVVGKAGVSAFTLTASGEGGKAAVTALVSVALPAAHLQVTTQRGPQYAGGTIPVSASGLAAGEPYTVTVAGIAVRSGTASATGTVSASVQVPVVLAAMSQKVAVVGSTADRLGSTTVRVVGSAKLKVKAAKTVKRGKNLTVTVKSLAPYEPVAVSFAGKTVRGTASASGSCTLKVSVAKKAKKGKKTVVVTGLSAARSGRVTVKIK